MCCMKEIRWKGQGASFVGTSGQRYKLRMSKNDARSGRNAILAKEEITGNVVKVRKKKRQSDGNCVNFK